MNSSPGIPGRLAAPPLPFEKAAGLKENL